MTILAWLLKQWFPFVGINPVLVSVSTSSRSYSPHYSICTSSATFDMDFPSMGGLSSGRASRLKGRFPTAVAGSDATNAAAIDDADDAAADAVTWVEPSRFESNTLDAESGFELVEIKTINDAALDASNDATGGR